MLWSFSLRYPNCQTDSFMPRSRLVTVLFLHTAHRLPKEDVLSVHYLQIFPGSSDRRRRLPITASCTSSPALIPHARRQALQLSESHRTVKVCSSEQAAVSVVIQILRLMNHTVSCPKVFNNYESLLVVF